MPISHEISRSDANREIKNFHEIKKEANDAGVFDNLSTEAKNYYKSDRRSFVFYKDQLDDLFTYVEANAYRVYFAAKDSGYPTLVVVPCQLSTDESSASNKLPSDTKAGDQYPGDPDGGGFSYLTFDIGLD